MSEPKYIIGVDEAGRGPLAGPVAVGVVCVTIPFDWNSVPGVNDSKKVSPKNREVVFKQAKLLKKQGILNYSVILISAKVIDKIGITHAVSLGISRAFKKLNIDPNSADVRLDGLLKAPVEYKKQRTIIKGDAKEKVIGLASIMAKVTRDRAMVRMARRFPAYSFDIHKGYGTRRHCVAIKKHGLCLIHRRSFCKNLV